jgi:hypothetical protein
MVGGRCSRRRGGSSNVGRKRGGISGSKRGRIALSSTESEYLALSTALRDVIPLMGLIRVMRAHGFNCQATHPKVHCRAFEDNSTGRWVILKYVVLCYGLRYRRGLDTKTLVVECTI